jgi:hypothetical protein
MSVTPIEHIEQTTREISDTLDSINARVDRILAERAELLAALKETRNACAAAMRVIAEIDVATKLGVPAADYQQRFVDEAKIAGVVDGFGVRADAAIAKAEGR